MKKKNKKSSNRWPDMESTVSKLCDVIDSCVTVEQFKVARRMVSQFYLMFPMLTKGWIYSDVIDDAMYDKQEELKNGL